MVPLPPPALLVPTRYGFTGRGYFGTPFKDYRGVTQGYPLSPTIFNVVVYVFFIHCFTVVSMTDEAVELGVAGTEGFGRDIQ